jgi:hypothetical protein
MRTWTIEITEDEVDVLGRNMDAMQSLLRERELTPELADDFHKCLDTLGAIVARVRREGG